MHAWQGAEPARLPVSGCWCGWLVVGGAGTTLSPSSLYALWYSSREEVLQTYQVGSQPASPQPLSQTGPGCWLMTHAGCCCVRPHQVDTIQYEHVFGPILGGFLAGAVMVFLFPDEPSWNPMG